jgi:hypothetical protein
MEIQESGAAETPAIVFSDGTANSISGGIFALARCGD